MQRVFRENIRLIRKKLNLTVKRFAELTGLSTATIVNIEGNDRDIRLSTINKLTKFSGFTFDQLNDPSFVLPTDFRESSLLKYKNDDENRAFFENRPLAEDAVNDYLIDSNFFKTWRGTAEIVHFIANLGWDYNRSTIQNIVSHHPTVQVREHPEKKNTLQYRRKPE
ncbi:MAG: helix-turn-helix domain-containing protein [Sphingobacterium sp.]